MPTIEVAPSLADVLTLAGAVLAAPLITVAVEMLKRTKGIGDYVKANGWEQTLALVLTLALVIVASVDRHQRLEVTTLNDVFVSVVAFLAIAKLSTGFYDEVTAQPGSFRGGA